LAQGTESQGVSPLEHNSKPKKGKATVPNKLAQLNAKENFPHEMEILTHVM
jgi:hypothetical protein